MLVLSGGILAEDFQLLEELEYRPVIAWRLSLLLFAQGGAS